MSKEAKFRKKIFSVVEEVIQAGGSTGIDASDVTFHLKRHYGASERMVTKYIEELTEREFILAKGDKLVWNTKKK